jgi:DNA polymerase elongation subunit (family B)
MKGMLKYFRDTRIKYKQLAEKFEKTDPTLSASYSNKQLPIKIFINSMFGALSAPQVFAWGDMYMGEQITCTGRQYLRQMIRFFMTKGYVPLVMDTDGVNFSTPDDAKDRVYVGRGLNWKVKEGKEYYGPEADVAEYNDIFMRGEMALDTDGVWPSCINLARKNYAVMEASGKIKLTGNTIKSKKLPLYIEDFLDKGVKFLLEGKGQDFIEWYYEYLQKIYNKQIPLMKIAQRAKVKLSIDNYIKRTRQKTKSGGDMSRMAHIELAIKHKLNVNLGDVIYYVNNGLKASDGDVQKITKKLTKKQTEQYITTYGKNPPPPVSEIQLNCYMLNSKTLEDNPEMTGEYNVARAIATFNKRIEPLLVVFKQEVRDSLLVNNPDDRGIFTKGQCELINGHPFEEGDQDTLEEVLTLSEGEVRYWDKRGISPNYIYELAETGWEEYI